MFGRKDRRGFARPKFAFTFLLVGISVIGVLFGSAAYAAVGNTPGTFAVSPFGAATYTIPIWAPPGPHGVQPNIALVYNSGSGNGDVGVGWSLSGLGSIERCNQTYAQDGAPAPVTLTLSDTFCLNGQRLRLTSGTYGEAGSTYATEVADFTFTTAYGAAGNGPAYFVVQDRTGRTYTYGSGGNSQVLANGTSTALSWLLSQVSDPQGNAMTIAYTSGTGTAVPSTISWAPTSHGAGTYAYTMTFVYGGNVAQSSVYGNVASTSVVNTSLLGSITIAYSGTTVKKYVLGYQAAPTTGRDRLTTVQECADSAGSNCVAPTQLTYQNGTAGVGSAVTLGNSAGAPQTVYTVYDLNGDGINDLVWLDNNGWEVSFGTASGFSPPMFSGISSANAVVEDVDGSGIDSFLVAVGGYWSVYKWNGSSFTPTTTGIAVDELTAHSFALADVNGDGLPDLITTRSDGYLYVRLNTSTAGSVSFSSTATQTTILNDFISIASSVGGSRRLDFYGSGQQDLYVIYAPQRIPSGYILHFTGSTFVLFPLGGNNLAVDAGDFNDDGCTDILGSEELIVSPCDGNPVQFIGLSGSGIAALDWDGDGRRDLLSNNGGTVSAYLSNGTGFASTASSTPITDLTAAYFYSVHNATGDGHDALVVLNRASPYSIQYYLHNGAGQPPDLLTNVTDGYGNSVSPTYLPISQAANSYFFPRTDATYPNQNYIGPLYVVNQATFSDPSGQLSSYSQQHFYSGAWTNLQGRGLEGFEAHEVYDSRNGVYETFQYEPAFPYTGILQGHVLTENNTPATTISQTNNTLACTQLPSGSACPSQNGAFYGRYFPYASNSTVQSYELGATPSAATRLVATTSTSTNYDNYGNPRTVNTTVTDSDVNSPNYNQTWTTATTSVPNTGSGVGCTSLLSTTQIAYSASVDSPSVTINKSFTDDLTNCDYTQIVTQPNNPTYQVTESLGYDAYGNVNSDSIAGVNMSARLTSTNWGTATGQFPMSRTDPTGAVTQYNYNFGFGLLSTVQDPNGVTTSRSYDGFGRKIQETRPDGTYTQWTYNDCSTGSGCAVGSHTVALTGTVYNTNGSVETDGTTWFDPIQRPVVSTKRLLASGSYSRSERHYDSLGRLYQRAAPCVFSAVTTRCPYMTTFAYDDKNRVMSATRPISASNSSPDPTSFSYAGDTTITTDSQGKQTTKVSTPVGGLVRTQDDSGYYIRFSHDAYGSVTGATDSAGVVLATMTYDYGQGAFRRTLNDADLGNRSYTVDALGDVTSWSDANGSSFTQTFDALSRPLTRTEPDLTTVWTWGSSAANHNLGQLQSISANGWTDAYTYDSLARLQDRTITIPSDTSYSYDYSYDATTGLLGTVTYPTSTSSYRLKLQYAYQNGLLQAIFDYNAPTTIFWIANATNARGQLTQETLGNGVVVNRGLDDVTGLIESIQSGVGGGTGIQNQSYLWDYVGNLIQRQDNNQGLTESIQYDDLYRIKQSALNGTTNLSMTYTSMGNELTLQAEGGPANTLDYTTQQTGCSYYANSQPHAPRSITNSTDGTISYCFDENGNGISQLVSGVAVGTSTWTSYNQPNLMSDAYGNSSQFYYNGRHQRWKQVATNADGTSQTTTYVGGLLEKVLLPSGTTQYRHYIQAGSSTALYIRTASSNSTYYITKDHLGSPNFMTGSTGAVVLAENFAALGYRRGSNWTGIPTDSDYTEIQNTTQQGFTGQEMMDNLASINMNGRVNNAFGQFYSPDPYVQNPSNTQSFNRYAYVSNNPLTYIDPSGFEQECVTYHVYGNGSVGVDSDGMSEVNVDPGSDISTCFDVPDPTPPPTPPLPPNLVSTNPFPPSHDPEKKPPAQPQPQGNQPMSEVTVQANRMVPCDQLNGANDTIQPLLDAATKAYNEYPLRPIDMVWPFSALRGTYIHSYFAAEVTGLGAPYSAEVSYLGGVPVPYGTPGSIRADATVGPINAPLYAVELKSGAALPTPAETAAYRANLPPGTGLCSIVEGL